MLELYHWEPNASAFKTLICLHEKGLAFESRYLDLLQFEQYRPEFLRLNPNGQVPVLLHDGKALTESQFINEYLDEVFPRPALRPRTAELLWRMRVWGKFTGEVLAPAVSTLGCHAFLAPLLRGRDISAALADIPLPERRQGWLLASEDSYGEALLDDSRRKVKLAVGRFEERLGKHPWLVGDDYSLADIEVFAWSNALDALTPDVVNPAATPGMTSWLGRIRARAAVRAALGHSRRGSPAQAFAPGPEHSRWG